MQPDRHISKTYFFYAIGDMDDEKIHKLETGINMAGFTTRSAAFRLIRKYNISQLEDYFPEDKRERYLRNPDGPAFAAELTIHEGKKHEVKRMLEAVHCRIFYLKRLSIGGLRLDDSLAEGQYRPLTDNELRLMKTY